MRPTVRRPGKMFIHLNAKRLYVQMNVQSVVPSGGIEPPYCVPQTHVLTIELKRDKLVAGARIERTSLAYETKLEPPPVYPAISLKCTNIYFFLFIIGL